MGHVQTAKPPWSKYLTGATSVSVCGTCGVAIQLPYLLAHNATQLPSLDTSPGGILHALAFLIATAVPVGIGAVARRFWPRWVKIASLIVPIPLIFWIYADNLGPNGLFWLAACWPYSAACLGLYLPTLVTRLRRPAHEVVDWALDLIFALPVLGALVASLYCYSLGVLPLLPPMLGGIRPSVVVFSGVKKPGALPMISPTESRPVLLMCEEGGDYWVSYKSILSNEMQLDAFSKTDLGTAEVQPSSQASGSSEVDVDTPQPPRPRAWQIKVGKA